MVGLSRSLGRRIVPLPAMNRFRFSTRLPSGRASAAGSIGAAQAMRKPLVLAAVAAVWSLGWSVAGVIGTTSPEGHGDMSSRRVQRVIFLEGVSASHFRPVR